MRKLCAVLLIVLSKTASATCAAEIMGMREPTETQSKFAQTLAGIGLDGSHELIYDSSNGVHLPPTTVLFGLNTDAPFTVMQLDTSEGRDLYGQPKIIVRPVNHGPFNLSLQLTKRDYGRLSAEQQREERREMANGNLRVLGADPMVLLHYGLQCQPSPEAATWLHEGYPHRHVHLAAATEIALLESLGAFASLARMQQKFPDHALTLNPNGVGIGAGSGRLTGTFWLGSRPLMNGLQQALHFYTGLYRSLGSTQPSLLGLAEPVKAGPAPEAESFMRAYQEKLAQRSPKTTLKTFRMRCPIGDLVLQGYESDFLKAPAPAVVAPAPEPLPLAARAKPEEPVVAEPPAPTRTEAAKNGHTAQSKPKRAPRRQSGPRRTRKGAQPVDAKPSQE